MRPIDGDALKITLDTFATLYCFGRVYDRGQVMECIDAAPTIGDWIPRLLTLDELRALPVGSVVWEEYRQDDRECWHLAPTVKSRENLLTNWYEQEIALDDELLRHDPWGYQARYWSAEPTEEEREAVSWTIS